jgi:hypothetical protein
MNNEPSSPDFAHAAEIIERTLQADYQFWYNLISGETERLRFNGGYEPLKADLYPCAQKYGPAFIGKTKIAHVMFRVTGSWAFDSKGKKILVIEVLKAP